MGNCIRHESPMQWGGDDWEDGLFSAPESSRDVAVAAEAEEPLEKSRRRRSSNAVLSVAPARKEVKIRITKRRLEELLGKQNAEEEKPVQQLVSQLLAMSASGRFETGQRSWRPALKSIPEVNLICDIT